jgi:TfoX/Sxy family transcriptional regulator of competence genes
MKFEKAPAALVATFDRALLAAGGERRQMFGYPCAFEQGQMFGGIFGPTLIVRLDEAAREAFLREGASPFEPMPGRRMKEYVVLPAAVVADDAALAGWFGKARAYARTLPPKAPRSAKVRAAKGARKPGAAPRKRTGRAK